MVDQSSCSNAPTESPSDPSIAGAGVILSFAATAAFALTLSFQVIIQEVRSQKTEARISRKVLLSFSDQQALTGILIQCIGLVRTETMIPYHFFIIWMLSCISTTTHSAALLALLNDLRRDWVLRWLRQSLMFINLLLSLVYGSYILKDINSNLSPNLAIQCAWIAEPPTRARSNATLSLAGTAAVMVAQVLLFAMAVAYLNGQIRRWLQPSRLVGFLVLTVMGAGATIRIMLLSQAFGQPSVKLADEGETMWTFGQFLPLFLLLLPLISAIEMYRGELRVPAPVADDQPFPLISVNVKAERANPFQNTWKSGSHEQA